MNKEIEIPEGYKARIDGNKVIIELKESEDERIRRAIIELFKEFPSDSPIYEGSVYTMKDALAYLEKQKEQKWSPSEGEMGALYKLCYISNQITDEDDTELIRLYQDLKREYFNGHSFENMFLDERQKEQKHAECNKESKDKPILTILIDALKGNAQLEWALKKAGVDVKRLVTYIEEQKSAEWREDYREEDLRTRFAFYTYKDEDDVLYLSNVFVEETSRNKGFGTKILAAAEKVAETLGAINIRLKVKQNSPANAWYRKNGYGYLTFEGDYDWLEKTLEYLKPSKKVWSEEDKDYYDAIIAKIEVTQDDAMLTDNQIDFLKSLPERFIIQPKQEWSEEDWKLLDEMRDYLMSMCYSRDLSPNHIYEGFIDLIDRLKSLRPQPHWTPSKEQMEALENEIKFELSYGPHTMAGILQTLYDDLQKL